MYFEKHFEKKTEVAKCLAKKFRFDAISPKMTDNFNSFFFFLEIKWIENESQDASKYLRIIEETDSFGVQILNSLANKTDCVSLTFTKVRK